MPRAKRAPAKVWPPCSTERCRAQGVVFQRWSWWCDEHAPGTTPDPTCQHSLTSPLDDREVCAYCGGDLGPRSLER
jgi:hypothetical protein